MKIYEHGDTATFYFIIAEYDDRKDIKGWTDVKQLAEFYIDFHKCPRFRIKKVVKPIEELNVVLDENNNDEIVIGNIYMKDTESKNNDNMKIISIPVTQNEMSFINEETSTFLSVRVDYSYLNNAIPYLKNKYQEAMNDILLTSLIKKVVYNRNDKVNQVIKFDQLMVLFRSFPDDFGM